ncbi:hypothetical protein IC232_08220 [Microvirga sp. BT688]|uniref:TnsA endonuclease N-terminal domain-containing protein n=1 Tax=Microvirga sp. TaxID=1873136 RepID=UPI0016866438|nr:TnsA endonuclease N-terminal domain-containing protein [Microvirga sp.]MBD2746685.1 hypothetical protein [Microvirga sp.]
MSTLSEIKHGNCHSPSTYEVRYRNHPVAEMKTWEPDERRLEETRSREPEARARPTKKPELIRGSESRNICRRGHHGYRGKVPLPRLKGKVIAGESLLACDFALVTDAQDENITNIISQPFSLEILICGRLSRWTPDYLIERKDGLRELVEAKLLEVVHTEEPVRAATIRAQLDAYEGAAREHGYKFRLVTEHEIRIQPMLYNAKLIHRHSGPFGDRGLLLKAILALGDLPSTPIVGDIGAAIGQPRNALELAIRLDRLGHIRLDRTCRFSRTTPFRVQPSNQGDEM